MPDSEGPVKNGNDRSLLPSDNVPLGVNWPDGQLIEDITYFVSSP